jgi:DNA-binding transcriptional ArsR family regulator
MSLPVDPYLATLFGSETRVRTLAPLANSPEPLTAYRIAALAGVNRIKVYTELASLARVGIVRERPGGPNRSLWELLDEDVRRILQRRARVVWSDLWATGEPERARRSREILDRPRTPIDLSEFPVDPKVAVEVRARYAKEFERPPEKGPSRKTR